MKLEVHFFNGKEIEIFHIEGKGDTFRKCAEELLTRRYLMVDNKYYVISEYCGITKILNVTEN